MDLEDGHHVLRTALGLYVRHQDSGDGRHSTEFGGCLTSKEVAEVGTIGESGSEHPRNIQPIGVDEVLSQSGNEGDIIDEGIGLEVIAHIPVLLTEAVLGALGVADGKAIFVREVIETGPLDHAFRTATIAVENEHQRTIVRSRSGFIVVVFPQFLPVGILSGEDGRDI